MNNFDQRCRMILVPLKLIYSFLALFFFCCQIPAQQNHLPGAASESFNAALPLKLCQASQNSKIISTGVASDNVSTIFVASEGGIIEKFELTRNSSAWATNLGGEIVSEVILSGDKIILLTKVLQTDGVGGGAATYKNFVWSLDAKTGLTNWQLALGSNDSVFLNGYLDNIFVIGKSGTIVTLRASDGRKIFEKNLGLEITSPPLFFENKIYLGTVDKSILILSDDGAIILKTRPLDSPAAVLAADRDGLLAGGKSGFVYFGAASTAKRFWKVRYGGEISSLAFIPQGILVASLDNFVRLISRQNGGIIWKRRLAGRISAKPLVTGDYAIFTTVPDNNMVVLDLRGGRIVNQISLAGKGAVLSAPVNVGSSLVFSTGKGIFSLIGVDALCSKNQGKLEL